MGISTMQSYKCAQIFEAVGLSKEVVEKCFKGNRICSCWKFRVSNITSIINLLCLFPIGSESRLGGVTFELLANEALERHRLAFGPRECDTKILRNPGFLHYRSGILL